MRVCKVRMASAIFAISTFISSSIVFNWRNCSSVMAATVPHHDTNDNGQPAHGEEHA